MKPLPFSVSFKSGLAAFGLAATLLVPSLAEAMPLPSVTPPAGAVTSNIVQVRDSWAGGNDRGGIWRNRGGWHGTAWRGGGGHWRGGGQFRGGGGEFRGGFRHGFRGGRFRGGGFRGGGFYGGDDFGWAVPGLLFGLGMGLPYGGYYGPDYYGPGYYYGPSYSVPRRVYHVNRGVDAHEQWCYARYRSYRASDNTFQPNNGPRRQCRSPY
ncbi:BA14K family protein [Mesorhizobium sp. PUT5]|uniref:BA14K family protein n=1 Tax=Mesorhizobium sp. PUT5 TaxID=3454629 RepID=UPI003FA4BABF